MRSIRFYLVSLIVFGLIGGCAAIEEYGLVEMTADAPVIDTETIRIHYLPLTVSNAYFIETEQGLILVDAGLPIDKAAILDRMEDLGWDDICLIFITHAHIDHYGSAAALRDETGAPIAIEADDAEAMAEGHTRLGTVRDWEWTNRPLPAIETMLRIRKTEADIILHDGDPVTACGLDGEVVHLPGHTPGSSALLVEDTYAFVGDLLSTNGDAHAQRSYADDWSQLAESLIKMRAREPAVVFPGHGQSAVRLDIFETLEMEIGQTEE